MSSILTSGTIFPYIPAFFIGAAIASPPGSGYAYLPIPASSHGRLSYADIGSVMRFLAANGDKATRAIARRRLLSRLAMRLTPSEIGTRVRRNALDGYLISFPKCGRTWLRVLMTVSIAKHLSLKVKDITGLSELAHLDARAPFILVNHDEGPHLQAASEIRYRPDIYDGKKVLFLLRDPRDVLVSMYFQATRRRRFEQKAVPRPKNLSEMITQKRGGLQSIIKFYNVWSERAAYDDRIRTIHYEDLLDNPRGYLRRCLEHFGIVGVSEKDISAAVTTGRIENMKSLERSKSAGTGRLLPGDEKDPESFKVRRGIAGGYRDYFTAKEIARINALLSKNFSGALSRYK